MERWMITSKRADFNAIAGRLGISPVLARLMRNRDLITDEEMKGYLHGRLKDIPSPYLLKDAEKAVDLIRDKIKNAARIRIISDYDADGVSSNYILWKGLRRCGALVDYRIPDRIEDGYGINENLISQAKADGIDTIITCDNGIAAMSQIQYARDLGMTVVVTDHHDIPYEKVNGEIIYHIPPAHAVVNPKQADCRYPYKQICGAAVCYKFMEILYEKEGIPAEEMEDFLPIAAIATVCDVMPLQGENRILVKEGLLRMPKTNIIGLQALLEATDSLNHKISAYSLGFVIGPCINASGRLKTAQEAMDLLLCQEKQEALRKARDLVQLNNERKEMTKKAVEEAMAYLENTGHVKDKVLIVFLPDCHESIAGIIAGRIREHYNKPSFVLTRAKDAVKGSGRSIEAYHMFQAMSEVKDCFLKFGGHPMAAGLSLEESRIEELRHRLNENARLTEDDFIPKISIDIAVPFSYLSESFLKELELLEPFGNGNPKPLFAQKNLKVRNLRVLGQSGRCTILSLIDENGYHINAKYFGEANAFLQSFADKYGEDTLRRIQKGLPNPTKIHVTYHPQINDWRGERSIEIVIQNYMLL